MPVLGLVISLDADSIESGGSILDTLRARPQLDLGELQGMKLPVVLECVRVEEEVEALRNLAGVAYIDVVFAEFADLLEDNSGMEMKSWS